MQALLKQKDTELEERGKLLYKTKARQLSLDLLRCMLLTATVCRGLTRCTVSQHAGGH